MNQDRILILGAYGKMGSVLTPFLRESGYAVFTQGRRNEAQIQLDPTNLAEMTDTLKKFSPSVIINLAALTNVDECEANPFLAYQANTKIVQIASVAIQHSNKRIHLIQISTDQVYGGPGPSREDDIKPINVYALTKYCGELEARSVFSTVLRTNFICKTNIFKINKDRTVSDWIVHSALSGKKITLFDDVLFSPLHIRTLCGLIENVIRKKVAGTYNLGSIGGISKAEFGIKLAQGLNLDLSCFKFGSVSSAKLKADRPLDMIMNCTNFIQDFNLKLPTIDEEVSSLICDYKTSLTLDIEE